MIGTISGISDRKNNTISKKIEIELQFYSRIWYNYFEEFRNRSNKGHGMTLKNTFKALADPVRRDILITLRNQSLTVGEIVDKYNLSNSTISYHLSMLKKAGLVIEKKYKNYIYYEVNVSVFEDMMVWITQFIGGEDKNEK